jgi:hypothetical protein
MEPVFARSIAHASHAGQHNRDGILRTEHIERVAASVTPEARTVAFLHDVIEWTDTPYEELRAHGLSDVEVAALELLTRADDESYASHVLRIAHAKGAAGRLARTVKVADLEEHLQTAGKVHQPGAPPYAWARRHIVIAQERRGERRSDQIAYVPTSAPVSAPGPVATQRWMWPTAEAGP